MTLEEQRRFYERMLERYFDRDFVTYGHAHALAAIGGGGAGPREEAPDATVVHPLGSGDDGQA
jgi:hypothetical protein